MRARPCAVGISLLCVALLSTAAAAQPAPAAREQAGAADDGNYTRLIAAALAEFEEGRFEQARSWFERAHALRPSARTYFGLGVTAFELGRHAQAVQELELALRDSRLPLEAAQRSQAQDVIARASREVGVLRIELAPDDAALAIDGAGTTQRELVLPPGSYSISARATGFREHEQRVRLAAGERQLLRIALQPIALRVPASRTSAPAAATERSPAHGGDEGSVFESFWLWTAVAVVVGGGIAAFLVLDADDDPGPRVDARIDALARRP